MARAKIMELDIVRAIAIMAVVVIHGTTKALAELPAGSLSHSVYLTLNKASNFAVPVFIWISGLVLFYRYWDTWNFRMTWSFYRKRLMYIVVPYLLWAFFYYMFRQWIAHPAQMKVDMIEYVRLVQWGRTGYHLYFMIIIIQFYILFPLLMTLAKSYVSFGKYLIPFGVAVQAAFYSYGHWVQAIPHKPALAPTYFSMFAIGGYIGMHYDSISKRIQARIRWIVPLFAVFGALYAGLFLLAGHRVRIEHTWYELLFNLYAVTAAVTFVWLGRQLLQKWPRTARWLTSIGAASFGIYLMHPAVLTSWRTYIDFPDSPPLYHLTTLLGMAVCFAVPWFLSYAYRSSKQRIRLTGTRSKAPHVQG